MKFKPSISKVPFIALVILVAVLGIFKIAKAEPVYEVGVGAAYTKTLTGADKKVNSRIELMRFNEIKKLTDFEYGIGLKYQLKSKVDDLIIPTVGLRYYPLNSIPLFAEGSAGLVINYEKKNYGGRYGIAVGLGRNDVVTKIVLDLTDGNVYDRFGSTINLGASVGYRF